MISTNVLKYTCDCFNVYTNIMFSLKIIFIHNLLSLNFHTQLHKNEYAYDLYAYISLIFAYSVLRIALMYIKKCEKLYYYTHTRTHTHLLEDQHILFKIRYYLIYI